jgi:ATP-dependent Clp endopeptidase proteolytic subunit ClpP
MTSYSIPYVTTRTSNGERTVDIYSRLLAERVIYLGTPIDDGVANAIIAQLIHLESESPDQAINLYINSPGGSIPATLAIYDAMQFIRPAVETTCVGQAAATAAMLLAGGATGRRQILAHGRVVIHAPAAEGRGATPTSCWRPTRSRWSAGCSIRSWQRTPVRRRSRCVSRKCPPSIARPCTSQARGADIDALGIDRGHRTLTVLREGGKITAGHSLHIAR